MRNVPFHSFHFSGKFCVAAEIPVVADAGIYI